jgi:hypothetical protein
LRFTTPLPGVKICTRQRMAADSASNGIVH